MGLKKLPDGIYVLAEDLHLQRMVSELVVDVTCADNLVLIKVGHMLRLILGMPLEHLGAPRRMLGNLGYLRRVFARQDGTLEPLHLTQQTRG